MNARNYWIVIMAAAFLEAQAVARPENWSPAYSEDQLDLIGKTLQKWKQEVRYPIARDVFKGRNYQPDKNSLKDDATVWEVTPDSFRSEEDARRAGAVCDFIKGIEAKTCLLKLVGGQGAWIFVYDQDATGRYAKTGVIAPPTWYGLASVALVDVFRTGKTKFILIEHQGDSGTGTDEKIHWLLGWHDGAFRTVLRETVFSYISCLGEDTVYRMNYRIVKGKSPRVEAAYSFDRVFNTAYPYNFHAQWKDWLFWDEKRFSFYDSRIEDEKIDRGRDSDGGFSFRLNVEHNRKKVMALPPLPHKLWEYKAVSEYWKDIGYRPLGVAE